MLIDKSKPVICFGEVLWDMLPGGAQPGGALLNVAVHLKKNHVTPLLISRVGNDNDGVKLLDFLTEFKINTAQIQTDKTLPTSRVLVKLDQNNNATYEICQPVAWDNILYTPEIENACKNAGLLIYGTLATRNRISLSTLLKIIEKTNAPKFVDVNLRPPFDKQERVEQLLHAADFAKLNNQELEQISNWHQTRSDEKEQINWFAKHYKLQMVCVTRGENGAVLFSEGDFYEHPGFKVKTADTVGAGDSFLAALIAALAKNNSPQKAIEFACATGAFVASKPGAVPDYSIAQIQEIINHTSE